MTRFGHVRPEAVKQFQRIAEVGDVPESVLDRVRLLDEKAELEPHLMRIVGEVDETPHGPTEIADQLTVHLEVLDEPRFAAIVTKGKASQSVRARDVTYQLTRAARVPQCDLLVLAAVGDIQDDVKADLALVAGAERDWMILDRAHLARLFIAYGHMCPRDGSWLKARACPECDYEHPPAKPSISARYAVLSVEDKSHGLAKRFSAHVWIQAGLSRPELGGLIQQIVDEVRRESYSRNEMVAKTQGSRLADAVWVFAYEDPTDQPYANWVCRAIWISRDLDARWAPVRFGQQLPGNPELSIDWRESARDIRRFLDERRVDKGTYLRAVDQYIASAPDVIAGARTLIGSDGSVPDDTRAKLAQLAESFTTLPRPDDQRVPPFELSALDDAYGAADAQAMNIFLPFTDRGRQTWDAEARARVARTSIRGFDEDWAKLLAERRRVR